MSELPEGWTDCKLQDCVTVLDSLRVPVNSGERKEREGEVPYYGATGQVGWIDDYLFDEELLLIGEDGAPFFDKTKPIAYVILGKSWVNNHAHVLRAHPELTSNFYLKYFLDQFDFHDYVNGTTRLKLTQGAMNRIPVRLAPFNEQRRIVAKLEKLLSRVDAAQARLTTIPHILKQFRQSVLAAACSGRLTADWRKETSNTESAESLAKQIAIERLELAQKYGLRNGDSSNRRVIDKPEGFELPEGWTWLLSSDVFYYVTSGSRGWAKYYCEEGAIFIRVGNLDHDTIDLDLKNIQRVRPPANIEGHRTKVMEGDVLVSITADVGMVGLVSSQMEEAYINQHIALARPVNSIHRRYLAYFLAAANGGQEQLLNLQRGMTKAGLGLEDIKSVWIALPSLPEQQEIVCRVEALFKAADALEARCRTAKAHVNKLTQSILARAFRGELVPQDPHDEPATVLLERINQARANLKNRPKL
jgi:type I restriction enzyme S subunit